MECRYYILLRPRHDVPIRRWRDVPLRPLSNVPPRRSLVFRLRRTCDVVGTSRETLLRRHYDIVLSVGISVTALIEKCKKKAKLISGRRKFVLNLLLKHAMGANFW